MADDKDLDLDAELDSFSLEDLDDLEDISSDLEDSLGDDLTLDISDSSPDLESSLESASQDDLFNPDDDFLSDEELASLDSQFDLVEAPAEAAADPGQPDVSDSFEASDFLEDSGGFDEVSLDDFVTFDDENPEESFEEEPHLGERELPQEDEAMEEFLDIDIEINDDIDDEELEILEGASPRKDDTDLDLSPSSQLDGAETVDLSEFGDFTVEDFDMDEEVSRNATESIPQDDFSLTDNENDANNEVQEDETRPLSPESPYGDIAKVISIENLEEDSSAELPDMPEEELEEDFLLENEETVETGEDDDVLLDDSLNDFQNESFEPDFSNDFEDILSGEKDSHELSLEESVQEPDEARLQDLEEKLTSGLNSISQETEILRKIETELSQIRQEISSLKLEMTGLRVPETSTKVPGEEYQSPVEASPSRESESKETQGFFDEDDDEVIALTGDELDNILSSAEITEEEIPVNDLESSLDSEDQGVFDEEKNFESPEDEAYIEVHDDILLTDEEGNLLTEGTGDGEILGTEAQDDVVFFEGTGFDEVQDEEALPESEEFHPLPGGDEWEQEEELELELPESDDSQEVMAPESTDSDLSDNQEEDPIPDSIELVESPEQSPVESPLVEIPADLDNESDEAYPDGSLAEEPESSYEELPPLLEGYEPINTLELESSQLQGKEESSLYTESDYEEVDDESSSSDGENPAEFEEIASEAQEAPLYEDVELDLSTVQSPLSPMVDDDDNLDIPFDEDISLDDEDEFVETAESTEINVPVPESFDFEEYQSLDEDNLLALQEDEGSIESAAPQDSRPTPATDSQEPKVLPDNLKEEIRSVLSYMDRLLESLPDDKIQEFAESEHFETYKKLFEDLGLLE